MEQFEVGLNLFDVELTAAVIAAMAEVARVGLGPTRRTFELRSDPEVFDHEFDLSPLTASVERVNVRFVTPTELKVAGGMAPKPDFEVLMSRIRDRVSNLRSLYGAGPLEIDFRGFAERAAKVTMLWFEMQQVDIMRHSSRTGQVHSVGGFTGRALYKGYLAEFIPYLEVARYTGVGRHAVWGNGEIHTVY